MFQNDVFLAVTTFVLAHADAMFARGYGKCCGCYGIQAFAV